MVLLMTNFYDQLLCIFCFACSASTPLFAPPGHGQARSRSKHTTESGKSKHTFCFAYFLHLRVAQSARFLVNAQQAFLCFLFASSFQSLIGQHNLYNLWLYRLHRWMGNASESFAMNNLRLCLLRPLYTCASEVLCTLYKQSICMKDATSSTFH